MSGSLIVLLGLWGGLVPFIGPYFDYAMHSDQTWQWFSDRFWLEVLPAAVTVAGGVIMIGGVRRLSTSFGAMLALSAGLWFIVGPNVSMLWNHGAITIGPPIGAHNLTRTLEWLGFFYALGGLITMFSAYALGFIAALPIVDERVVGRTVAADTATGRTAAPAATAAPASTRMPADEPTTVADDSAATSTTTGRRRSGGLFRRRSRETTRT